MPRSIENKLIEEFKNQDSFTREALYDFFRYFEPNLKEGTFGWRIYDLKSRNIIKTLKRGLYVISYKPKYKPPITSELLNFSKKISEKYEDVSYCLWDTIWINEFSRHQISKRTQIIEIESEFIESLYYYLADNFKFDLFLNPDVKTIQLYIAESRQPVIIKKLITRSPMEKVTQKKVKLVIPMLEKILVDLFSDEKLFYFYQGSELNNIFESAIHSYTINFTKLFSYARRRDREEELKSYLIDNMREALKDIIND